VRKKNLTNLKLNKEIKQDHSDWKLSRDQWYTLWAAYRMRSKCWKHFWTRTSYWRESKTELTI